MIALEKYLNEHLSGSHGALMLLKSLIHGDPSSGEAYQRLHADILGNRLVLEGLMHEAGLQQSRGMHVAGRLASVLAQVRFRLHGLKPGELGLVEALEVLELGIRGQCLLWRSLMAHGNSFPQWNDCGFTALLEKAEAQQTLVEALRLRAVKAAFYPQPVPH